MDDASGSSAVAPSRRSPTVRGVATVLVGVIAAALLLATLVTDGDDGEGVIGARSVSSSEGTAPATAERGDGAGGVDHGDEAAEHLALDLVWNDLSTEERERLCSDYERSGLVATHESFAAGYGVEGAPSSTVFRRWVEPRCGG